MSTSRTLFVTLRHRGMLYREQIEPGKSLNELLSDFAATHDIRATDYKLKHHRLGFVNLNMPFTLTGIETNAQLELVPARNESETGLVTVAIQNANSQDRTTGTFPADTSLWQILCGLEADGKVNFTNRVVEGKDEAEIPVLTVLRREFNTFDSLVSSTLSKLGINSGSVLVRAQFKPSGVPTAKVPARSIVLPIVRDGSGSEAPTPKSTAMDLDGTASASNPSTPRNGADVDSSSASKKAKSESLTRMRNLLSQLFNQTRDIDRDFQIAGLAYKTALQTLLVVTKNIVKDTYEPKFRTIHLNKKLFEKLGRYSASRAVLSELGFVPDSEADPDGTSGTLKLPIGSEDTDVLSRALDALQGALDSHERELARAAADAQYQSMAANSQFSHVDAEKELEEQLKAAQRAPAPPPVSQFDKPLFSEDASAEPDLPEPVAPTYDISEVRRQLNRERFAAATDEEYATALSTLQQITRNLLKVPIQDQHRKLNLANPKLQEKAGRFEGAVGYLKFLGFASSSAEPSQYTIQNADVTKIDRAATILKRILADVTAPKEDTNPIERCLLFVNSEKEASAAPKPAERKMATAPMDVDDEDRLNPNEELALVAAAWARSENSLSSAARFRNRRKEEEEREKAKPRYPYTVIRVLFENDKTFVQARFNPNEPLSRLFELVTPLIEGDYKLPDQPAKQPGGSTARYAFHLFVPPTDRFRVEDHGDKSFRSFGLVPAANLTIKAEPTGPQGAIKLKTEHITARKPFFVEPLPSPINKNQEEKSAAGATPSEAAPSKVAPAPAPPSEEELERRMLAKMGMDGDGMPTRPKPKPAAGAAKPSAAAGPRSGPLSNLSRALPLPGSSSSSSSGAAAAGPSSAARPPSSSGSVASPATNQPSALGAVLGSRAPNSASAASSNYLKERAQKLQQQKEQQAQKK